MSQITSDFERFLSANYPDDYRKITGPNVEESLITTILSRYSQKYQVWERVPEWIKALYHDDLPQEIFVGHEPYTNFVNYLGEHHQDYTKINAFIFNTITKDPDNTAHCNNILDKGYTLENAMLLTYNYNTRKELLESGLFNTPEGKKQWFESRQSDIDITKSEFKEHQKEKYALNILAKMSGYEENIAEKEAEIKALQEQLANEENEAKRKELEKEIKSKQVRQAKIKQNLEKIKTENSEWLNQNKEIVEKVRAEFEKIKIKGYAPSRAKTLLEGKIERERISTSSTLPPQTAKKMWEDTRKKDKEAILFEWKQNKPEKYALHLLKQHLRQQQRNENQPTTQEKTPNNAENTPSSLDYLKEYEEFANTQKEPLRGALLKTAKAILTKQESSSSKEKTSLKDIERRFQNSM